MKRGPTIVLAVVFGILLFLAIRYVSPWIPSAVRQKVNGILGFKFLVGP